MKTKRIKGKVCWQSLGTGFWGIIDLKGGEWRPVNMPEQLKQEGKQVTVTAKVEEEDASIFMWGKSIRIVSFTT
jgi:hypothetical protein